MMRETVPHYVEKRDGDREVHVIPDGNGYDVYFVKDGSCLSYMFGLPNYQPSENKYYDIDDVFQIAWKNYFVYEEIMKSYEGVFDFYKDRINACPLYGFKSGHEILATVTRCAFRDTMLTDDEFNSIINLAEKCHIKMMEDNYNGNWNE